MSTRRSVVQTSYTPIFVRAPAEHPAGGRLYVAAPPTSSNLINLDAPKRRNLEQSVAEPDVLVVYADQIF